MESICRLCFQPAALFQVPGYNLPTCVKCSEHLTSNNLSANFYQTIRQDLTAQQQQTTGNSVVVSTSAGNLAQQSVAAAAVAAAQLQQTQITNSSENNQTQQQQQQTSGIMNSQQIASITNHNGGVKKTEQVMSFELEKTMQNLDVDMIFNEEGSCPLCSKTFSRKSSLLTHIRNHSAERKFVCTFCNKGFTQAANLRNHERIHTNDRPYVCGDCGKTFTQITNLNNHRRLHTGERPFVCIEPECGRSFAQVTNLNNHMKTHHKVQQYCCNQCPKKFTQVTSLNQHLQAHAGITGYYCPRCPEKTFKQQSALHTHMKSHGLAFPYECQKCDEKFIQQAHLDQHNKMHDEFKFKCDMCPSSFNQEGLLKKHIQRHIEGSELPPPKRSKKQLQPIQIIGGHTIATTSTPGQRGRPPKKNKVNILNDAILNQPIKTELQITQTTTTGGATQIHINHLQPQQDAQNVRNIKTNEGTHNHHQQQQQQQNHHHQQQQQQQQQQQIENDDLKCHDCGVVFSTDNELRDHIFYKHPERRFMQAILDENRYLKRIQNQQTFVCNLCCNVFKTQLALVRHTAKFHGQLM